MRRIGIVGESFIRFCLARFSRWVIATALVLLNAVVLQAAEPVAVFPSVPYDAFIVYESLAVFWIFLIGLIVILRMKLREIERTQQLGADEEDPNAPLLQ
jgi:lysylphosphatidylglycerol synthetase-like protein (DUF2156 family)